MSPQLQEDRQRWVSGQTQSSGHMQNEQRPRRRELRPRHRELRPPTQGAPPPDTGNQLSQKTMSAVPTTAGVARAVLISDLPPTNKSFNSTWSFGRLRCISGRHDDHGGGATDAPPPRKK
ncbi:unnamed protein product [Pleuronectes platessa]|uniref:Uncharacterized protein n=1 Tax=Pleuronectes platessa TaxID=8262 RepID=A0A9N7V4F8_PLEPL|nr:unnamed protein product [Pleuronectes platessa]